MDLISAFQKRNLSLCQEILNNATSDISRYNRSLVMGTLKGNTRRVRELLRERPSGKIHMEEALIAASYYGRVFIVLDLLDQDLSDLNNTLDRALNYAAENNQRAVIKELLNHGANLETLKSEFQLRYQKYKPEILSPEKYYLIEDLISEVKTYRKTRWIFYTKYKTYVLF
jgi:hypothetical protein